MEGGPTREFPGDRTFVIGRSQNVDFSIPHPNLSREHVRISLKSGDVWMEDLGSANGTFVQGQRLPAKSQVKIKPHYRILLGTGSNVVISLAAIDESDALSNSMLMEKGGIPAAPKGDADLPGSMETTMGVNAPRGDRDVSRPLITTPREAPVPAREPTSIRDQVREQVREQTRTGIRNKTGKFELDFPQQHFPQEAKKEKVAELRIIEAKKQRVIEDIHYKEREVEDLRSKIRVLREESLKLKELTEGYKREIQPLEEKRVDLETRVAELDIIFEEKIDALETGFQDLKTTLEESHAVRMARADKDFKEKTRRMDEEYSRKLHEFESGTQAIRAEGDRLREQVTREKTELEENLKKIRADAEALEAERRLTQVKVDTEIAQLQGTKLKLENELETIRRERERVALEAQNAVERGRGERAKLEEARKLLQATLQERDAVLRSIEETKQSEDKNLQRIEELRTQISTLEARSQGIEGMIRQAEQDAEATRRRAKEEAEQHRKTIAEQIEAERQAVRKNTEAQAMAHVQAAEAQAAARLQLVEDQANAKLQSVEAHAASRIQLAEAHVKAIVDKASADANALEIRVKQEADRYFAERKETGDALYNEAYARASTIEETTRAATDKASAEMSAQLEQKKKAIEAELAELKRRADQEVRQVRAGALAEIDAAKEREAKDFMNRVHKRSKEIGDQIDRVVGAKLATQFGVNMDPVAMKAFSDEIHSIVDSVLGPGKGSSVSKEATFSTILPVNTQARDKAARYWKKMGVAAIVVFVLILGRVIFPGLYSKVGRSVASALEVKDNTDEAVRRMLRERQLSMTFVTEQDQQFRDSYTDNILYTEGFIEMKEDIESQKLWTLELNKFFQNELGLTEKAIVQFGSAEGRMVRELLEDRKSLIPATSAAGIQKMRGVETGYIKEMKFVVRTEGNWQKFLSYHRDFYQKYTQSLLNRAPAAAEDSEDSSR
jgi:hypothetical protein